MKIRLVSVTVAALAAISLAACGSDSGSSAPKAQADGTYKREDLAKKANQFCDASKAAAKNIKPVTDANDPAQIAAYVGALLPIKQTEVTAMSAVKPSADAKADWDALVAKDQEAVTFFQGILAKAKAKDPSGLEDLKKGQVIGPQFQALAKKIGAGSCAS